MKLYVCHRNDWTSVYFVCSLCFNAFYLFVTDTTKSVSQKELDKCYLILSFSASSLLTRVVKGHRHLETKDLSNLPWEAAQTQKKYRGSRNSIPHTLNGLYVYGCIKH